MRSAVALASALAVALDLASASASAHAALVGATPRVGSSVSPAPRELHLSFSEGVDAHFSGVEITGPDGRSVAAGRMQVSGAEVTVPLSTALSPGTYKVVWHVVSVDTHKTQGSFTFDVQR